jgi:hypothetical protein
VRKRIRIILLAILVVSTLAIGTGMTSVGDNITTQQTALIKPVDGQPIQRLLALKDEVRLDAALSLLLDNNTLTDSEAVRIKNAWSVSH